MAVELYGNTRVGVYIPSRYRNGTVIPPGLREIAHQKVVALLKAATFVDSQEDAIGSFMHDDGRVIEEPVSIIFTAVHIEKLSDESFKQSVLVLAETICRDLDQEEVAVEWGRDLLGVSVDADTQRRRTSDFGALTRKTQWRFSSLVLRHVTCASQMRILLQLGGWKDMDEALEDTALRMISRKGRRKAYMADRDVDREIRRTVKAHLRTGDMLFTQAGPDQPVRVWLMSREGLRGGREIQMVRTPGSAVAPATVRVAMAILGGVGAHKLGDILDQQGLTHAFFREYRRLFEDVAEHFQGTGMIATDAARHAQLLLGRIMFVRFLEERGWMGGERCFLAELFRKGPRPFLTKSLERLFHKQLDLPPELRRDRQQIPYLNGGLFRKQSGPPLSLPDALFDPTCEGSILHTFYRFDFTADEPASGGEGHVAVNPVMFGSVLESLCTTEQRKKKGIHYTPVTVARLLASQGILRRLAVLTGIELDRLEALLRGDLSSVTPDEADIVRTSLPNLRIVDPACGSGSLLLASLNVMMDLHRHCGARMGEQLLKGGYLWSNIVRDFAQQCLYGVDIDPEAVEVTRLRIWLAMAVGDEEPRALPDLQLNIRAGDSLCAVPSSDEDLEFVLPYDRKSEHWNEFVGSLHKSRRCHSADIREMADQLEKAERDYVLGMLEESDEEADRQRARRIRDGGAVPFSWKVHFADVFSRKPNRGFDVVIANPPYVRVQHLDTLSSYQDTYDSMTSGNVDLYLAFVEQALRLAGRDGQVSFIMPNFSRTKSGGKLREILAERGAVDLWIDFGDLQVFPTAKNFVAILVGTATVRRRKTFVCRAPRDDEWPPEDVDCCLQGLSRCRRHYGELWHTGVKEEVAFAEKVTRGSTPLGSLVAGIGVGIQTSADKVYLFKEHVTNPQDGLVCVFSRHLGKRIQLELAATKLLAKGSASLVPYALRSPLRVLWPYGDDGLLLEETVLREQFPHAWRYLNRCKKALCARESRKFDGPAWWQFGRSQGLACWEYPKLTLPSIMKPAIAYLDQETGVAVTASGAGGGGAWVITPQDQDRVRLEWLLAVLNSEVIWRWLRVEGDPKLWGWRGVDRSVIERIPVAVPNRRTQNSAARIVKKLLETQEEDPGREQHISKLDSLVRKAYGVL